MLLAASAALVPMAHLSAATECMPFTPGSLRASVEQASVIVLASTSEGPSPGTVIVKPSTYLKGAAESRSFLLQPPRSQVPEACPPAELAAGSTVLLVLESERHTLAWPDVSRAFIIEGGVATNQASPPWALDEAELQDLIRGASGQTAVPASEGEPGASIDWTGTVLPVGVALAVVFGIGLMMMRVWHRIDPT